MLGLKNRKNFKHLARELNITTARAEVYGIGETLTTKL